MRAASLCSLGCAATLALSCLANAQQTTTYETGADGVTYPVGFDPHFLAGTAYGVIALPQTFFLNAKHQIVDRVFGKVTLASLHKGMALATAAG